MNISLRAEITHARIKLREGSESWTGSYQVSMYPIAQETAVQRNNKHIQRHKGMRHMETTSEARASLGTAPSQGIRTYNVRYMREPVKTLVTVGQTQMTCRAYRERRAWQKLDQQKNRLWWLSEFIPTAKSRELDKGQSRIKQIPTDVSQAGKEAEKGEALFLR